MGASIALSEDLLVIGAPAVWGAEKPGSVHLFEKISGSWVRTATLLPPDDFPGASYREREFGSSVAVCGSTIAVGFQYDTNEGATWGSVFLYGKDAAGTWIVRERLTIPCRPFRPFAEQICFAAEDALFVTVECLGREAWRAHCFRKIGTGWVLAQSIAWPGATTDSLNGIQLIAEADRLLLGARFAAEASGLVYEYVFRDDSWRPVRSLSTEPFMQGEFFGSGLALSRDTLLVGLRRRDLGPAVLDLRVR